VPSILKELDLSDKVKCARTPMVRIGPEGPGLPFEARLWMVFRRVLGQLWDMSHDRPDVQYATKSLSRVGAMPCEGHWQQLRRLARTHGMWVCRWILIGPVAPRTVLPRVELSSVPAEPTLRPGRGPST
jgi:hypothetical protein